MKKSSLILLLFLAAVSAFGSYRSPAAAPSRLSWELPIFSSAETENPPVLLVYDEQGVLDFIAVKDETSPLVHVFEILGCEDPKLGGWSQNAATLPAGHILASDGVSTSGEENGSKFRSHTREYDAETGLYYFRHRYYDPELGRFTQTDPMGYADSMNLYAAFGQSPMNFSDPMGLLCDDPFSLEGMARCAQDISWVKEEFQIGVTKSAIGIGMGTIDLAYQGMPSSAVAAVQTFNTTKGTIPEKIVTAGLAAERQRINVTTLGFSENPTWEHAGAVFGPGDVLHGASHVAAGWKNRNPELALEGVGEIFGGTGKMAGWAAAIYGLYSATTTPAIADQPRIAQGPFELEAEAKPGVAIQSPTKPAWPMTAQEMEEFLKVPGTKVPDLASTPGRNKVAWDLGNGMKIVYEEHPYHPGAPEFHKGPHWHLDTPGQPHVRYVPGEPIPGY
jgi:RHS repeat-associated protein